MVNSVVVTFGPGKEYEYNLQAADLRGSADEARRWFDKQFIELGCEPVNPVGKTLTVDKILAVASAMGNKPFADNAEEAHLFARNAMLALRRVTIRVDIPAFSIGF